eukprot:m.23972 g.23972  ORF g.23972 m.23972 type:complete len:520 (+) comp11456_c0_seq1:70-1629(+)
MFYPGAILAKRGPLGQIWLAAHWPKRLSGKQVKDTDVSEACQTIIKPPVKLALRTSGHLLLGVIRIHDQKQKHLLKDCNDAYAHIKMVFRPGAVDATSTQAAYGAITLAEDIPDFDVDVFLEEDELQDDTLTYEFTAQHADDLQLDKYHPSQVMDPLAPQELMEDMAPFDVEVGRHDQTGDTNVYLEFDQTNNTTMDGKDVEQGLFQQEEVPDMDVPEAFGGDMPPPAAFEPGDLSLNDTLQSAAALKFDLPEPETPFKKNVKVKAKRAKRMVVDDEIEIPSAQMKLLLSQAGKDSLNLVPYSDEFLSEAYPAGRAEKRLPSSDDSTSALFLASSLNIARNPMVAQALCKRFRPAKRPEAVVDHLPQLEEAMPEMPDVPEMDIPEMELEPPQEFGPNGEPIDMTFDQTMDNTFGANQSAVNTDFLNPTQEDESTLVTSEEFEDAGWSRRTKKMLSTLQTTFETEREISYDNMTAGKSKKVAAACFLELLVLKTKGYVQLEQSEPFDDIIVTQDDLMVEA